MNLVQKNLLRLVDLAVFAPQFVGQSAGLLSPGASHLSISESDSTTRIHFEDWPEQRWQEVEVVLPGSFRLWGVYTVTLKRAVALETRRTFEALAADFRTLGQDLTASGRIDLGRNTDISVRRTDTGCAVLVTQTRTFQDLESSAISRFRSFVESSSP